MATRNRVIYQSEAVYVTTDGTVFSGSNTNSSCPTKDLQRVQSCNYSFNIGRTDVNQFGQLGAIDRIITESPSVSVDTSYLLANMANEARLGFYVTPSGSGGPFRSCITNLVDAETNAYQKNWYILSAKEGKDADITTDVSGSTSSGNYDSVIGIGNVGLTSYSIEAAVGGFPTVSVAAEGLNMNFTSPLTAHVSGDRFPFFIYAKNPAIDPVNGIAFDPPGQPSGYATAALPAPSGNAGGEDAGEKAAGAISVLRPGDIRVYLAKQTSEDVGGAAVANNATFPDYAGAEIADAHLQSFNISFDMSRSPIEKLGSRFAYARPIDFPISISFGMEAVLADLTTGALSDIVECDELFDARIQLNNPACGATAGAAAAANYILKGVKLDSQSFSLGMGDNKTVSLSFTSQIGGPEQSGMGLFMSGYTGSLFNNYERA
jgi:hypothetical protein